MATILLCTVSTVTASYECERSCGDIPDLAFCGRLKYTNGCQSNITWAEQVCWYSCRSCHPRGIVACSPSPTARASRRRSLTLLLPRPASLPDRAERIMCIILLFCSLALPCIFCMSNPFRTPAPSLPCTESWRL